jgi:hypothetical protein
MRLELTTLVVIGTDCTGCCKANYHTIMTMTIPFMCLDIFLFWEYFVNFLSSQST